MVTLASTSMFWNRLNCWKTIAMRERSCRSAALLPIVDLLAVEPDAAAGWRQQAHQNAQQRALAGARGTDQADDLPLVHGEADALEHGDVAVVRAEVNELELGQA